MSRVEEGSKGEAGLWDGRVHVGLYHHELPLALTNNVRVSVTAAVAPHCSDANISRATGVSCLVLCRCWEWGGGGRTFGGKNKSEKAQSFCSFMLVAMLNVYVNKKCHVFSSDEITVSNYLTEMVTSSGSKGKVWNNNNKE